jgi:hypothetical protein
VIGGGLIGDGLRALADHFDPPKRDGRQIEAWHSPKETLFERDEGLEAERREVAMSLMDEDTLGFVVVRARRDGPVRATFDLGIAVEDPLWPAMNEALARVIFESERVLSER